MAVAQDLKVGDQITGPVQFSAVKHIRTLAPLKEAGIFPAHPGSVSVLLENGWHRTFAWNEPIHTGEVPF